MYVCMSVCMLWTYKREPFIGGIRSCSSAFPTRKSSWHLTSCCRAQDVFFMGWRISSVGREPTHSCRPWICWKTSGEALPTSGALRKWFETLCWVRRLAQEPDQVSLSLFLCRGDRKAGVDVLEAFLRSEGPKTIFRRQSPGSRSHETKKAANQRRCLEF